MKKLKKNENGNGSSKEEKPKRDKAPWAIAGVFVAATIAILFAKCPGKIETIQCGDGVCVTEHEQHVMGRNGERNPNYCKPDCHEGDGVCDNDPNETRNAAHEVMGKDEMPTEWTNGEPITLPLETDDSVDCKVNRCGEGKGIVRGPLLDFWTTTDCTPEELQEMLEKPEETAKSEKSHCLVKRHHKETCDKSKDLCGPETDGECFCGNHEKCQSREKSDCGDGEVTGNEECDPASKEGRSKCHSDEYCGKEGTRNECTCMKEKKCGNGKIDPGEECDPKSEEGRSACDPDEVCTNTCECVEEQPEPECENGRLEAGEDCEPGVKDCDSGKVCKNCKCVKTSLKECGPKTKQTAGNLIARVTGQTTRSADPLREESGAGLQPLQVTWVFKISSDGLPSVLGGAVNCSGKSCPKSLSRNELVRVTRLNLQGISLPSPEEGECKITVKVPVAAQ